MSTPALDAEQLYRFYHAGDDETLALRGVSLALAPGEMVAVTGPSGSGKSTLLACLAGLDDPDAGMVRVRGERLSRRGERERARIRSRSIGMVFQSANLVEHLSLADNIHAVRALADRPIREGVTELLDAVGLRHRARALPAQLSGGEAARAAIAVAVANDPAVILADEPTGELDSGTAGRVVQLLARRAAAGAGVLVVTHDEQLATTADRVMHLHDGQLAS